jgi:hypothetical protein
MKKVLILLVIALFMACKKEIPEPVPGPCKTPDNATIYLDQLQISKTLDILDIYL